MIKNIVFDISNVLAPFRFTEYLVEKGFDEAMIKQLYKATAMTPYWEQFERGKLTNDEVIECFVSCNPSIENEIHKAFDSVSGIMGTYDYTEKWIDSIKHAGYRIYCITNFTPAGYYQCYDQISFVEKFDGCIFSFQEGVVKPERRIYELLLERYNLKPEECVFIDDTSVNVDSAIELGMYGIKFKNYDDAVEKMRALDIEI